MPLLDARTKPVKPAEFAERCIIESILDKSYAPGDNLPGERVMAQALGVTRPTLRETLQRLARDGWITIAHGKPTRVNDFLSQGGLGILTTLARYGDYLSHEMILHLLEARTLIFPGVAYQAAENDPGVLLAYLDDPLPEDGDAPSFVRYDWGLQMLMVDLAGNVVLRMIFNDFAPAYRVLGEKYFGLARARDASRRYYKSLKFALADSPQAVRRLAEAAMADARAMWEDMP